jgi:hypothetical protein
LPAVNDFWPEIRARRNQAIGILERACRPRTDRDRRWNFSACCRRGSVLLLFCVLFTGASASAQSPPQTGSLQARMDEVAEGLGDNPRLKKMSLQQRKNIVEFISGNMLFAMLHELAHTAIADLDLPVLGREEDAADNFAVLRLLHVGSDLSHRVLVEAAKGWFLSDRRDRQDGEKPVLFDNHGLDEQRAYQIVCLMVGSDPADFTDLADETKLPNYRQEGCKKDYTKAFTSWNTVLKRHARQPDQPKTHIDVVYGDGKGNLDGYAKAFRHLRLLETVAEHLENDIAWPAPFTLEMQSCGFINAQWINPDRKLLLCYELAADFAELYRDFNEVPKATKRTARRSSPKGRIRERGHSKV